MAGNKELFVRVKATDGTVYNSAPIQVNVIGAPKLLLQGAGPNQMITTAAPAKLKVESNVLLSSVKYLMTNTVTGTQKVIADLKDASQVYTYTPAQGDNGSWKIKAVGTYGTGQTASTEEVTVKVYTGKIYTAQPIIEKSKFLNMASSLAVVDFNKSGMSAALQTAQAILETGWGQSVPVDKYSGQFSSNLFGIKGTGTAGSVISNTWEEYNGVAFRVDAKFRAYYSVNESWWDHNKLLMTGTRYEPFRNVMFDSSLGAWALRRAGYATDSKYPVKLMDIIETYQLEQLDQVGI
jgi:flagellum-specific peptidoglycan hydrolase FlgJ